MYIAPNTIIRILKNCPLDTTYEHTLYFGTKAEQTSYFSGLTKYTLNNQSYQRVNKGTMRVEYKAEDLYDCNYLMFQNTSFGNKWFYAFIKSVEYINNITSEIEFEIDVMQTWFFDYTLGQCLVDREHSVSDNIGDNLIPENLELGEYVAEDFTSVTGLGNLSIVVACTFDDTFTDVNGGYYGKIFSGLHYEVFPNTNSGAADCAQFITEATEEGKSDGIVSIFLMPSKFVIDVIDNVNSETFTVTKKLTLERDDGKTLKNKKLLTYPYNFLYCTNLQGASAVYPYEYFSTSECEFDVTGDMSPVPSVVIEPRNYKGVVANYDEKMVLSGYPQLSYNIDSYKAWLAQNGSSIAVNALTSAVSLGNAYNTTSLATAGKTGGGAMASNYMLDYGYPVSAITNSLGILSQFYQHAIMPPQAKGGSGSTTMCALGLQNFAFMKKHIRPEFVTIIDDFFSMYGYACHRVKTPNRKARPHWTYTKTVGCVVHGSVPCDDMKKICSIYDNGVTFWVKGSEVGNYNLDNRATGN